MDASPDELKGSCVKLKENCTFISVTVPSAGALFCVCVCACDSMCLRVSVLKCSTDSVSCKSLPEAVKRLHSARLIPDSVALVDHCQSDLRNTETHGERDNKHVTIRSIE